MTNPMLTNTSIAPVAHLRSAASLEWSTGVDARRDVEQYPDADAPAHIQDPPPTR